MTDYKDKPVSNINPSHYRSDDIECIEVVRHMSFCQGNAIKYLWRLGQKDTAEQELKKALWYMDDLLEQNWPGTVVNIIDIDKDIFSWRNHKRKNDSCFLFCFFNDLLLGNF